ncbi:adhesin [Fibrella aquatica]|jgi:hypothetical protein|uniref:adhesin n=1 Tax=Fibrella aquatica TaxID=3242487 RepID=UPI00352117BE
MIDNDDLLDDEQDDDLLMEATEGAEFGDEGSGATSGYGDTTEDDLSLSDDEEVEDPLEIDPDDELQGDDIDDDDL